VETLIQIVIQAITLQLPVHSGLHETTLVKLASLPELSLELKQSLSLGALLAVLFAFRYDWTAMLTGMLRALLERRRLMTLDERLPFFLLLSLIPPWLVKTFGAPFLNPFFTPQFVGCSVMLSGFLPLFGWLFSRQSQTNLDWTPLKALAVGCLLTLSVLPGWDPLCLAFVAALCLHFRAGTAMRYSYYLSLPPLFMGCLQGCSLSLTLESLTALMISFFLGTFTILHFEKKLQKQSFLFQILHRGLITALAALVHFDWIQR
jgi:undecaprenyl-diphosphatase